MIFSTITIIKILEKMQIMLSRTSFFIQLKMKMLYPFTKAVHISETSNNKFSNSNYVSVGYLCFEDNQGVRHDMVHNSYSWVKVDQIHL